VSKRKTKCLTWGNARYELTDSFITLCGRDDPDCTVPDLWSPGEPRPKGVCPECWKQYRNDMLANYQAGEICPTN